MRGTINEAAWQRSLEGTLHWLIVRCFGFNNSSTQNNELPCYKQCKVSVVVSALCSLIKMDGWIVRVLQHSERANSGYIMPEESQEGC